VEEGNKLGKYSYSFIFGTKKYEASWDKILRKYFTKCALFTGGAWN
jgi:hypothetical protein